MKLEIYTKQTGAHFRPKFKEVPSEDIAIFKGQRANSVSEITVTVTLEDATTHIFQGDETSQNRLARSGWGMDKLGITTIDWKTFDNQIVQLTVTDIANILLKAGQAQSALWF